MGGEGGEGVRGERGVRGRQAVRMGLRGRGGLGHGLAAEWARERAAFGDG